MKVIAISDLHGNLIDVEEFDLLLICGDICPTYNHSVKFQEDWLKTDFIKWLNNLPYKDSESRVVFIAGNHDFYFEQVGNDSDRMFNEFTKTTDGRVIYLHNTLYVFEHFEDGVGYNNYKIFGTPYCHIFGNWAFMRDSETLHKKFSEIPEGLDFLITHDPPTINDCGVIHQGYSKGEEAGNCILEKYVREVKPKYVFSGHIHTGNHILTDVDGIKIANVSILDERYDVAFEPLTIEV